MRTIPTAVAVAVALASASLLSACADGFNRNQTAAVPGGEFRTHDPAGLIASAPAERTPLYAPNYDGRSQE